MSELNLKRFLLNGDFVNFNNLNRDEIKELIVELELKRCDIDQARNRILEFFVSGGKE